MPTVIGSVRTALFWWSALERGEGGGSCWLTVRDVVGYESDGGGPGPDEEERDDHLREDTPVHPEEEGPFRVLPNVPGTNLSAPR